MNKRHLGIAVYKVFVWTAGRLQLGAGLDREMDAVDHEHGWASGDETTHRGCVWVQPVLMMGQAFGLIGPSVRGPESSTCELPSGPPWFWSGNSAGCTEFRGCCAGFGRKCNRLGKRASIRGRVILLRGGGWNGPESHSAGPHWRGHWQHGSFEMGGRGVVEEESGRKAERKRSASNVLREAGYRTFHGLSELPGSRVLRTKCRVWSESNLKLRSRKRNARTEAAPGLPCPGPGANGPTSCSRRLERRRNPRAPVGTTVLRLTAFTFPPERTCVPSRGAAECKPAQGVGVGERSAYFRTVRVQNAPLVGSIPRVYARPVPASDGFLPGQSVRKR